MRAAMGRIPIAVVRPSIIVGDSHTGEIDRFDGPYLHMLIIVTSPSDIALPMPSRGDAPLNLVPADYVARAARAIGLDPRAPGRTFHIVDPAPLTARRVFELVALSSGKRMPRGFIPANISKALLRTPGLERFAKSPRAFLDALATPVTWTSTNADEILEAASIRCPSFESYVDKLVEYLQAHLREKREKREAAEIERSAGLSGVRKHEDEMGKSVAPCIGPGMVVRRVMMASEDVVFFKGIIEALEGLAQVFAERGGDLTVAAPSDRAAELDLVVDDLCRELGAMSLTPRAETVP